MKQVYPRYKRSRPLPFPLEDCSFPRSGLSDLATLGQTTVRSRKRKVLSRKRKSGLDLFLSGIYLFPALQNIYSLCYHKFSSPSDKILICINDSIWCNFTTVNTPFLKWILVVWKQHLDLSNGQRICAMDSDSVAYNFNISPNFSVFIDLEVCEKQIRCTTLCQRWTLLSNFRCINCKFW